MLDHWGEVIAAAGDRKLQAEYNPLQIAVSNR